MKAYFTHIPAAVWALVALPVLVAAHCVVMTVVPEVVRAVVPEAVRAVLRVM